MRPMIVVDHVTKEYRLGGPTAAYGMLRDAGPRMIREALQRLTRPSKASILKALDDVSFEVRAGETVELAARPVTVSRFEILGAPARQRVIDLDVIVECTTGTYVRSLARDLGAALDVEEP